MQQNSECWLRKDKDETVNNIISECCKLAQKEYKTRHDWVGKKIHWELCKRFQFDHINKLYMEKTESILENRCIKLCGVSKHKRIASSWPVDQV